MPANFENGVFGSNMPAWHGCGTVLPQDVMSWEDVVKHVPELDMPVRGCPIFAIVESDGKMIRVPIEDSVANFRADGQYVGIVGSGYVPVQGRDAFGFLSTLLGEGEVIVHTAGTLARGRKAWVQCFAPEPFRLHGEETETHHGFLTFHNSFDGTISVGCTVGATRVVCENTYKVAMESADSSYWFKHTTNIMDRVGEAREALKIGRGYWTELQRIGEIAMRTQFSDTQFAAVLDATIPILDKNGKEIAGRRRTNADKERDTITRLFKDSVDLANVRGTAWAAVNAFTAYTCHHVQSRDSVNNTWQQNRFNRIISGLSASDSAVPMIYEMAGIK